MTPLERKSVVVIALLGVAFVATATITLGKSRHAASGDGSDNPGGWTTRQGAAVTGSVVDDHRKPVEGARVEAHVENGGDKVAGFATTKADGSFVVDKLMANRLYDVVVTASGRAPSIKRNVPVAANQTQNVGPIPIGAGTAAAFSVVEWAEGRWEPLEVATVVVAAKTGKEKPYYARVAGASTDADGRATVPLHPGEYEVRVSKDGYAAFTHPFKHPEAVPRIVMARP